MQLFGGAYGDAVRLAPPPVDTFGDAMLALFIICTGENTFSIGWDLTRASGTKWAVVYDRGVVARPDLAPSRARGCRRGSRSRPRSSTVVLPEAESDSDDDIDEVRAREAPASEREATLKPVAERLRVPFREPLHGPRDATCARDAPTSPTTTPTRAFFARSALF